MADTVDDRPHIPVLLDQVLSALTPLDGSLVVDGTFGAGGYSTAFVSAQASVIGFDRDPEAIDAGKILAAEHAGRLQLVEAPFSEMASEVQELGYNAVDAVVLDIGVSSMQLDQAERGFAFRFDGPLDMRMDKQGPTAADIVNSWEQEDLANLFYIYGEERRSRAIAKLICEVREDWPIETTRGLATLIEKLMPVRKKGPGPVIHPATRVFQALRIAVNDELGELARALIAAEKLLKPGGTLAVVTFHSLEDRMVKRFLSDASGPPKGSRHQPLIEVAAPTFEIVTKRPIVADDDEMASNPRARSAKLRVGRRTDAPARSLDVASADFAKRIGLPILNTSNQRRNIRSGGAHARH